MNDMTYKAVHLQGNLWAVMPFGPNNIWDVIYIRANSSFEAIHNAMGFVCIP